MDCSSPGFPVHHQFLELAQTHVRRVSDAIYLNLCCPPLLLPAIFPSVGDFPRELALHIRWPKYWRFSLRVSPSSEYSEFISFRIWLVWSPCCARDSQESSPTPQFEASILWCSAFFMVQLSHLYVITWKIIVLTIWTFVSKVMSLLFNMLCRFSFLPSSKYLLISWLKLSSAVILEPKKIKSATVSIFPVYLPWSDAMILVFWTFEF